MIGYYLLLITMTLLGSFASFFLKKSTNTSGIKSFLSNMNFYVGGALYLTAAIINIYVLRFLPYSVVLPLTSITYIWTMILSYFLLREKISKMKIYGVIMIIIGALLIGMNF